MINDGYHKRGMNPSHLTPATHHSCCKPNQQSKHHILATEDATSPRLATQALPDSPHYNSPCCRLQPSMTGSSPQEKPFLHSLASPHHSCKTSSKALCVPANWKRVVQENKVSYISPSQCQLGSIAEVVAYLQTEGTCKCGLECPLIVTRVFNFDPQAQVSTLAPAPTSPCCLLHKLSSKSTVLPKKENLLTYNKRKRLKGKTRSPFDGVLVSQLLAQRDRLGGMKRKEVPPTPQVEVPPETKYFHLVEDSTKPSTFPILSPHPIIQNVNIITGNTSYNCPLPATANPTTIFATQQLHIGSVDSAPSVKPYLAAPNNQASQLVSTSSCSSTRSPHLFHQQTSENCTPPKPVSFEAMQFTSVSPFQTFSSSPHMTLAPSFHPSSPSPKILQAYETTPCSTYQRVESSQFVVQNPHQPAGCSPTLYSCHQPSDKPTECGRTNVVAVLPNGELILPDDLLLSGEILLDRSGNAGNKDEDFLKIFQERKFPDAKSLAAANPAISSVKFSNTSVPSYFSVAPTPMFSHCSSFTTDSSKKVQCQYGPAGLISLDGKQAVTSVTTSLAQVIPTVGLAAQPMVQVINTIPINTMQNTLLISGGQPAAQAAPEANLINILPTQTYMSNAEDAVTAQRRRARPRKVNQTVASMLQQVQPATATGLVVQQAQQIIHPMLQTVVLPSFPEASAPRHTLFPQLLVQPLGTTIFQVPGTLVAEGPQDPSLVALQPSAFSNGSLVPNTYMAAANSIPIIKTELISNPTLSMVSQQPAPARPPFATTTQVMFPMAQDGTFTWPHKMEAHQHPTATYGQLCKDGEGRSVGVQSVVECDAFYSGHHKTTGSLVVSSSQPSPPEAEYTWPPDPGNLSAAVRAVIQSEKIYKDNPYYMEKPEEAYGLCNSTTFEKGWQAKCDTTTASLEPPDSSGMRPADVSRRKRHRWDEDSLNQEIQEVRS